MLWYIWSPRASEALSLRPDIGIAATKYLRLRRYSLPRRTIPIKPTTITPRVSTKFRIIRTPYRTVAKREGFRGDLRGLSDRGSPVFSGWSKVARVGLLGQASPMSPSRPARRVKGNG